MTAALRQRGIARNRKWIARLMRAHHLVAKHRRRRRIQTTASRHGLPIAPNQLNRQFSAQRPNEKWVADITYIDPADGWLYLALVLDVFSRKIVGWAMEPHLETTLVEQARRMARAQRLPALGELLHQSDRGGQYARLAYQQLLAADGISVSMSRRADPYDNALMESCIARSELFAYLEGWYNRRCLHSARDYLSPDQFEQLFFEDKLSLHSEG